MVGQQIHVTMTMYQRATRFINSIMIIAYERVQILNSARELFYPGSI